VHSTECNDSFQYCTSSPVISNSAKGTVLNPQGGQKLEEQVVVNVVRGLNPNTPINSHLAVRTENNLYIPATMYTVSLP